MRNKSLRVILIALAVAAASAATASAEFDVSISFFHDTLAPHGRWVATSTYGDAWVPGGVAAGWAPYVDGQWEWTEYGWTWVSSDPWGDVAYHYGTWVNEAPYGWVWVPGTVWAPAWVTWAYTDDYIGWAPVPVSFAVTAHGYAGPAVIAPRASYVFVPAPRFAGVPVATVRVPYAQAPAIYARAHRATAFPVQGGIVHNTGLPVARVERAVGRRIEPVRAEPERLRVAPIPQGKAASYRVVAPKAERAAAIRKAGGGAPEARAAEHAAPAPSAHARPAPVESREARGHEAHESKPKKAPADARPGPAESHAARGHEAHDSRPKKQPEPVERPESQAQSQAAPREAPAPHDAGRPAPHAEPGQAQHGNPHAHGNAPQKGNGQPQHGNGHDKDNGPGKPKDR
jgi:hypothetical protein